MSNIASLSTLSLSLSTMQRQSLGSPVSKLHGHGAGAKSDAVPADDQKRNKHSPSSSSILNYDGQDDDKASKSFRFSFPSPSPPPRQEKFVHAIPILTIICFLILYLCSHSPSQSGTCNSSIGIDNRSLFRFRLILIGIPFQSFQIWLSFMDSSVLQIN